MTTTNGHPQLPPTTPAVVPTHRRLVVEVYEVGPGGKEFVLETCEPTEADYAAAGYERRPVFPPGEWTPRTVAAFNGPIPETIYQGCPRCHGAGRVPVGGAAWGTVEQDARCPACKGTGRAPDAVGAALNAAVVTGEPVSSPERYQFVEMLSMPRGVDGQLGTAREEGSREVVGTTPAGEEVRVGAAGALPEPTAADVRGAQWAQAYDADRHLGVAADSDAVTAKPSEFIREHIKTHEPGPHYDEGHAALAMCRAIVAYLDERERTGRATRLPSEAINETAADLLTADERATFAPVLNVIGVALDFREQATKGTK
jgi:hypothetical protein